MEHEVYVPFPADSVRAGLAERERVARCLPGLRPDAEEGEEAAHGGRLSGRLRLRVAGSTITYRGTLELTPSEDGVRVEGKGTEARGEGTVQLSLDVALRDAEDGRGCVLVCAGTVAGDGRLAEVEEQTASAAGRRLLDRFGAALAENLAEQGAPASDASDSPGGIGAPDDNEPAIPGIPGPESGARSAEAAREEADPASDAEHEEATGTSAAGREKKAEAAQPSDAPRQSDDEEDAGGLYETEVPPSSLEPAHGADPTHGAQPPHTEPSAAEAGHARRTMIGRSAEEVDHAPPRGRYAPVPVPEPGGAADTLRWVAPAAAAAVAGALLIGRAMRRRR